MSVSHASPAMAQHNMGFDTSEGMILAANQLFLHPVLK